MSAFVSRLTASARGAAQQRAAPKPPAGDSAPFLSTFPPDAFDRRLAAGVLGISILLFVAIAPFATVPLTRVAAFLPAYQSALVINDLITAALLLGQFRILRTRALVVLAAGYWFSALMAVFHALSFPGLFAPAGVIGGGGQTTAWLYMLWHAGFPLFAIGYALMKRAPGSGGPTHWVTGVAVLAATGLACAMAALATAGEGLLPPLMAGDADGPGKLPVAGTAWLLALAALVVVWRRVDSVLDLWLGVTLAAWIFDSALAAVLNQARFDLGWYAGRVYGLLASAFVLLVLLLENGALYARLARSNEHQRHAVEELETARQELEQAVNHLQAANRDLDAFAGALAHDLQQPTTSITAFAQVLRSRSGHLLPEQDRDYLERILRASQGAQAMIRSLLEFARVGQAPLEAADVDLQRVVAEARDALAAEASGREIAWHVGRLPNVWGDAALLRLAFINVLSNAIKYTRLVPAARIELRCRSEGAAHVIEVRDNGVGFDMAQAGRLFTPFQRLHATAQFEGTGMGLANVRKIVERHGGCVRLHSEPGEGTCVTLELPATGQRAAARHRPRTTAA